jgi:hypothetical protein
MTVVNARHRLGEQYCSPDENVSLLSDNMPEPAKVVGLDGKIYSATPVISHVCKIAHLLRAIL